MQEDKELTLEDVDSKIETLDSDIQRELEDIKDRLDAQEEVLISVNETLDRIEGYLSNTLGDELIAIEEEIEKQIALVNIDIKYLDEATKDLREFTQEEINVVRDYITDLHFKD